MQQPWNNFATNYSERGSYPQTPPSMYPTSPSQSQPSFNRSPAPFIPGYQSSAPPQQQQSNFGGYHPAPEPQPHPAHNGYAQQFSVDQHQQQVNQQSYDQNAQNGPWQQQSPPEFPPNVGLRQKNTREDPDMDEDFPSFKDIRGTFLKKQKKAELEERRSQTLPRQHSGPRKPTKPNYYQPEYLRSSAPIRQPQQRFDHSGGQTSSTPQVNQTSYQQSNVSFMKPASPVSPPKPRRSFAQVQSPLSPQTTQRPPIFRQISSGSGSTKLNMASSRSPASNASRIQEIPVHHIQPSAQQHGQQWQNIKPARDQIRYRPPLSLKLPSHQHSVDDGNSPRVVITSNSPQSPQKAFYRGEGTGDVGHIWQPNRRASISVASPGTVLMMSGANNKPRRRASYAEITLTNNNANASNSLPRDFSARFDPSYSPGVMQRSVSQVVSPSAALFDDGIQLFPRQRRYGPPNGNRFRAVHHKSLQSMPVSGVPQVERGYARVNMRRASMDQLLYPSHNYPQSAYNTLDCESFVPGGVVVLQLSLTFTSLSGLSECLTAIR